MQENLHIYVERESNWVSTNVFIVDLAAMASVYEKWNGERLVERFSYSIRRSARGEWIKSLREVFSGNGKHEELARQMTFNAWDSLLHCDKELALLEAQYQEYQHALASGFRARPYRYEHLRQAAGTQCLIATVHLAMSGQDPVLACAVRRLHDVDVSEGIGSLKEHLPPPDGRQYTTLQFTTAVCSFSGSKLVRRGYQEAMAQAARTEVRIAQARERRAAELDANGWGSMIAGPDGTALERRSSAERFWNKHNDPTVQRNPLRGKDEEPEDHIYAIAPSRGFQTYDVAAMTARMCREGEGLSEWRLRRDEHGGWWEAMTTPYRTTWGPIAEDVAVELELRRMGADPARPKIRFGESLAWERTPPLPTTTRKPARSFFQRLLDWR